MLECNHEYALAGQTVAILFRRQLAEMTATSAVTATLWSGICRVLPIRENGILLDLLFRADAWMEPPTGLPLVTVVVAVCHRLLQIRS